MPEPPRLAPVDALLPAVEPSVSQYRAAARTGPPNSDTASMAEIAAKVRSTFPYGLPVLFAVGGEFMTRNREQFSRCDSDRHELIRFFTLSSIRHPRVGIRNSQCFAR